MAGLVVADLVVGAALGRLPLREGVLVTGAVLGRFVLATRFFGADDGTPAAENFMSLFLF